MISQKVNEILASEDEDFQMAVTLVNSDVIHIREVKSNNFFSLETEFTNVIDTSDNFVMIKNDKVVSITSNFELNLRF